MKKFVKTGQQPFLYGAPTTALRTSLSNRAASFMEALIEKGFHNWRHLIKVLEYYIAYSAEISFIVMHLQIFSAFSQ